MRSALCAVLVLSVYACAHDSSTALDPRVSRASLDVGAGGVRDLGTLPGDAVSQAVGINSSGQIVGVSSGAINRTFLHENGAMKNLTVQVPFVATPISVP